MKTNDNAVCPECGSSDHTRIFRKETFNIPLTPFDLPEPLTIRYPLAKCAVCNAEYRNAESRDAFMQFIGESIQRRAEELQAKSDRAQEMLRRGWVATGIVLGVVLAHSLNLVAAKNSLGAVLFFAGVIATVVVLNAEKTFRWIASKRKRKDQSVPIAPAGTIKVDDDFMQKLIDSGQKDIAENEK